MIKKIIELLFLVVTINTFSQTSEVIIQSKQFLRSYSKDSIVTLGYTNQKVFDEDIDVLRFGIQTIFINNPNIDGIIESFLFRVKKLKFNFNYRLNIYKNNINEYGNEPGEDLIIENQEYKMLVGSKGLIEVDLSKYKINFPKEGVYLHLEIIKDSNFNAKNRYSNYEERVSWNSKKLYIENVLCSDLKVTWDFITDKKASNGKGYWVDFNNQRANNNKRNKIENKIELYFIPAFGIKVKKIK